MAIAIGVVAVGPLALLVLQGANASAAGPNGCQQPPAHNPAVRYSLWVSVCGPGHVTRNTTHTYSIVVKNFSSSSGPIRLRVIHDDRIVSSSIPYRSAPKGLGSLEPDAIWILRHVKPFQVRRVDITLRIKQHNDPVGSNITVVARGHGRAEHGSAGLDIHFVR